MAASTRAMACAVILCACGANEARSKSGPLAPSAPAARPDVPPIWKPALASESPAYTFADPDRRRKLASAFATIESIAAEEMRAQRLPGLVVGVVIDGELAFSKGMGVKSLDGKATPDADTIFRIGSITKSFTGLAVLSLRDDGALALDDPLARFVPEASKLVYPTGDAPPITLRQLLTHTSGLPGQGSYSPNGPSEADVLSSLTGFALESTPGTTYRYSNLGFGLLGIAASHAAHAGFREVVQARILGPLGMASTVWDRTQVDGQRYATGYILNEVSDPHPADDVAFGAIDGAGGLFSTVRDTAKYLALQLSAYPPRSDRDTSPIRRSTLREAHSTGFLRRFQVAPAAAPSKGDSLVAAEAESYGFGWESKQTCEFDDLVSHDGIVPGYTASVAFLRERAVGVLAMANGSVADLSRVSKRTLLALRATGGLVRRTRTVTPALASAMRKLLDVYNSWNDDAYRAIRVPQVGVHGTTDDLLLLEKEELAGYKKLHGVCRGFSPVDVRTSLAGHFNLECERGPFEMEVDLASDGKINGFVGISRDVPIPKDLRATADGVVALIRKWDDATYRKYLSKATRRREDAVPMFEALRAAHGVCRVKTSRTLAFERRIELECERGGAVDLSLDVEEKSPTAVMRYSFQEANDGPCPSR
jgi:CubicO group peptidase (beta-lactamase class C family)